MSHRLDSELGLLILFGVFSTSSVIILNDAISQDAFGFEENFVLLQTGIISTEKRDFAISSDFDFRVIQDGKIMRLSGITTTGEVYYAYQKIVEGDLVVKGKILVDDVFVPVKYKEEIVEQEILVEPETELIMSVKLPHHTYANYPFIISVKAYDAEQNPQANFDQNYGFIEDVFVNVTITNLSGEFVTSLTGKTDSIGFFSGSYLVKEDVVNQGEYNVHVMIDDGVSNTSQSFITFFRGDIRDYFHDTN